MHPDQIEQSIWPKSLVDRCILVVQGQRNQFVIPDLVNKSVLLLPGVKKFVEDATCSRIEAVVEGLGLGIGLATVPFCWALLRLYYFVCFVHGAPVTYLSPGNYYNRSAKTEPSPSLTQGVFSFQHQ